MNEFSFHLNWHWITELEIPGTPTYADLAEPLKQAFNSRGQKIPVIDITVAPLGLNIAGERIFGVFDQTQTIQLSDTDTIERIFYKQIFTGSLNLCIITRPKYFPNRLRIAILSVGPPKDTSPPAAGTPWTLEVYSELTLPNRPFIPAPELSASLLSLRMDMAPTPILWVTERKWVKSAEKISRALGFDESLIHNLCESIEGPPVICEMFALISAFGDQSSTFVFSFAKNNCKGLVLKQSMITQSGINSSPHNQPK